MKLTVIGKAYHLTNQPTNPVEQSLRS